MTHLTPSSLTKSANTHLLYHYFDIPHYHPNRPIIMLFRTVVLSAFYDAAKGCADSTEWLLTPSEDLLEIADYAELTPTWIYHTTHSIISRQTKLPPWRIWRYIWADI